MSLDSVPAAYSRLRALATTLGVPCEDVQPPNLLILHYGATPIYVSMFARDGAPIQFLLSRTLAMEIPVAHPGALTRVLELLQELNFEHLAKYVLEDEEVVARMKLMTRDLDAEVLMETLMELEFDIDPLERDWAAELGGIGYPDWLAANG